MARKGLENIKRTDAGSYRLRLELPKNPVTGKRQWHTETLQTLEEAKKKRVQVLADLDDNRYSRMAKLPLADYLLGTWLPYYRTHVRQSTYIIAEQHVRLHITPYLGSFRMGAIKPLDVLKWHATLEIKLSAGSIQVVHATLNKALSQAVKWEVLNRNPATRSTPKAAPPRAQTLWDDAQLTTLLTHLSDDSQFYTLVCLLAATGMRRGEALALQWSDIDLDEGTLHIQRTLTRDTTFKWILGAPKSPASHRFIGLAPRLIDLFSAQAMNQQARQTSSLRWSRTDLVFDRGDGNILTPDMVTWHWLKAIRETSLPRIRLHDLRHAAATRLLERGIALKVVSHQLGHSNIGVTANVYQHVTRPLITDAAGILGEFLPVRDTNVTADEM